MFIILVGVQDGVAELHGEQTSGKKPGDKGNKAKDKARGSV